MTALTRALSWFLVSADPAAPPRADAEHPTEVLPPPLAGDPPPAWPAGPVSPEPGAPSPALALLGGAAAVLGRPGEAEPVAAAIALALSRRGRARAATVIVLGGSDLKTDSAPAAGGTRASRRLAARLDAHGLPARPRGRLVWVPLRAGDGIAPVRRAMLAGAPAVVAVTAPRTAAVEELLAEQDLLLVVARDPGGPLAQLAAAAHRSSPVAVIPPLNRGPARTLARNGLLPPRAIAALLATAAQEAAR